MRRLVDFFDPGIEWVAVPHSLLAVESYRGFDGLRRFWGEFLSTWESYRVEPLSFHDAGDQVAVVVHIVGRTHELEVDETRSSLLTFRDGRVVRVESFTDPRRTRGHLLRSGARQLAGAGVVCPRRERGVECRGRVRIETPLAGQLREPARGRKGRDEPFERKKAESQISGLQGACHW